VVAILKGVLRPFHVINTGLGRIASGVAVVAMIAMVMAILIQVFFRYVLNNALPWPDEAARFMMLWMTGLLAPVAYRRGGFVAIDTLTRFLPRNVAGVLALFLLAVTFLVLIVAVQLGHKHVMSGCLFKSSTLWVPFTLEFALPLPGTGKSLTLCTRADAALSLTWGWVKMPLAVSYASLFVGVLLLLLVNIELAIRTILGLAGAADDLPEIDGQIVGAE
jgi:TRAP-type C4-dicarboxylate transport system permease small subunit